MSHRAGMVADRQTSAPHVQGDPAHEPGGIAPSPPPVGDRTRQGPRRWPCAPWPPSPRRASPPSSLAGALREATTLGGGDEVSGVGPARPGDDRDGHDVVTEGEAGVGPRVPVRKGEAWPSSWALRNQGMNPSPALPGNEQRRADPGNVASKEQRQGEISPCLSQLIAHRGACRKAPVAVQNRRPVAPPAEMGESGMRTQGSTATSEVSQ